MATHNYVNKAHLRGYYIVRLKSIKNYKYRLLFDVSITNAYILSPTMSTVTNQYLNH